MNLEVAAKFACKYIGGGLATIGRNGATELRVLLFYIHMRPHGHPYPNEFLYLAGHTGLFPANEYAIDKWAQEYLEGLKLFDMYAAGWVGDLVVQESELLHAYAPSVVRIPLRTLEPYYVDTSIQWSNALQNKRVAVVSSFTNTMKSQLLKKERIWGDMHESILPSSTQWSFVQTGYVSTIAGDRQCKWPTYVTSWEDAVEHVVTEVRASGTEIALIGCGSLGVIIASRLRALGISAIVMGGAIQVLFGIKGNRWETHDVIGKFWNDAWVYPNMAETPEHANHIEGACYWN